MKKGLKDGSLYKLDRIKAKLENITEFKSISLNVYQDENPDNGYFVEATIVVDDNVYREMDGTRGDGATDVAVHLWVEERINKSFWYCSKKSKVKRFFITDNIE